MGSFTKLFIQLAAQIVLARLLGPEQYGFFTIGIIVVGFANFLADFGISFGLIQKKTVSDEDIRYVVGWQLLLGGITGALLFFSSTAIADFFNAPLSAWVIKWLAGVCVLNSLCSVSMNLLKRSLDYKALNIAQVLSHFGGFVLIGIPLAALGFGVAALVSAWLVQAFLQLVLMYSAVRHPLIPVFAHQGARSMLIYGRNVLTANLTNWGLANVDRIAVGRYFSVTDIGLYSTAYNLLYNGTSALLGVIQSIFFSASSRAQHDSSIQGNAFLAVSSISLLFVGPVFAALAMISDTFILALYGEKWQGAATIFSPIALAMPLFVLWGLATPMLWIRGIGKTETLINLPLLLFSAVVVYVMATSYSPQAVAWAIPLLYLLRAVLLIATATRALELKLSSYFRACAPSALVAIIVTLPLGYVDFLIRNHWTSPLLCLLFDMVTALLLWRIGFSLVHVLFQPPIKRALIEFSTRMPPRFAVLIFGRLGKEN
jgi:O-antigen/teichoic acid export membrane protein